VERLRSTLSAVSLTELIELVPQLVSRSSTSADGHPDKKKLFSVQDFFRYAEIEGNIIFLFQLGGPQLLSVCRLMVCNGQCFMGFAIWY
jgi:hypothetical protein